jgi:SnoaL-like domain
MDVLQRLSILDEIRGLKARYCRFLDTKDWDGLAALFCEDAVLDVEQDSGNPPMTGHSAIIVQIRDAVINAATAHQVHTPEITIVSDVEAQGIWAMQDRVVWQPGTSPIPGVASITGYGQYHETYHKTDGVWLFASPRLTRFHVDMHPA